MSKFKQQDYPRHGVACIFTTSTGDKFNGHYDNGGARNRHSVFNTDTGKTYILPTEELTTWEYSQTKTN